LKGSIDQAQVEKISTFEIKSLKSNLLLLTITAEVGVPSIEARGDHYNIDGNLGGLLPVYGEGSFS
jgi:hypothetical protein